MKHTEKEMQALKEEVSQMWKLVISQLEKAKIAFNTNNIEIAREIVSREKRVDAFELKIDSDCENYIALFNPVAVDLRLILSIIKISTTLERIADFAESIARFIIKDDCNSFTNQLIEKLQIDNMFQITIGMLSDCFVALESENTKISGKILSKDDMVDEMYHSGLNILSDYLIENPSLIRCGLKLWLILHKLERVGDYCSNIVEEIVFYVDAKVLKHCNSKINTKKDKLLKTN